MSSKKLNDWIEFIGFSGVIVGLVFVYVEIRQNSTIARAQLSSETARINLDLLEQQRDKDFSEVLAKSYDSPMELTVAERIQMSSYLVNALMYTYRERHYYSLGLFETWDDGIRIYAPQFFGRGYGRSWWEVNKRFHHPEVVERIDSALSDPQFSKFHFQEIDNEVVERLREK